MSIEPEKKFRKRLISKTETFVPAFLAKTYEILEVYKL